MKNNKNLVKQVVKLLYRLNNEKSVQLILENKGYTHDDIESILKNAKKIMNPDFSTKRRLLWLLMSIGTFLFFYFIFPYGNYFHSLSSMLFTFIFPVLLGVFFSFFTIQFIFDFRNVFDFERIGTYKYYGIALILIILMFTYMPIIFISHIHNEEIELFYQKAIKTTGIIQSGIPYLKFDTESEDLIIIYESNDSQIFKNEFEIESKYLYNLKNGDKVDLVYYKNDPSIARLLITNSEKKIL